MLRTLAQRIEVPPDLHRRSREDRHDWLPRVRDLHVPTAVELRIFRAIRSMVAEGYRARNPSSPETWRALCEGEAGRIAGLALRPVPSALVEGISGVGKTQAAGRCLRLLGQQVIDHAGFPRLVGGHRQVLWLSVEVPPSGKAHDLARQLMHALEVALGEPVFGHLLRAARFNAMEGLAEWQRVAAAHFLGVLHLDEVQNLFRLPSVEQRERARRKGIDAPPLTVVEDQVLRWLIMLSNSGQIPLLASGTPDGVYGLGRRLGTLQRLMAEGHHLIQRFTSHDDPVFRQFFLPGLARAQFLDRPVTINDEMARLIYRHSAGVPRILGDLWVQAHRVALDRDAKDLRPNDFVQAAVERLAPLAPAVNALLDSSIEGMRRYEDIMRRP
jgi:hypothetical protein